MDKKVNIDKECLGSDEAGVTMLQFAIAFPVLMLLLIGFIDLARIYSVKALLQTGAEEGLSTALSIPNLDIDARDLDPANSAEFYDYYRYQWAKQHVMDAAERVPLSTLVGQTGSGNWAEVVPFQHTDSPLVSNAALLRPYECAREETGSPNGCLDGDDGCLRHPSLNSNTGCDSFLGNDPKTLKQEPIVVAMRARVKTILPVFNNLEVEGLAQGFRPAIPLADVDLSELGIQTPVDPEDPVDPVEPEEPEVPEESEEPEVLSGCDAPEMAGFKNTCRLGTGIIPAGTPVDDRDGCCCNRQPASLFGFDCRYPD